MKSLQALLLTLLLPVLPAPAAPAQGSPPKVTPAAPADDAGALLGTWRSTGESGERLEFRAGGVLFVNDDALRYTATRRRLTLIVGDERVRGTWRVEGDELVLELAHPGGGTATERYARAGAAASARAVVGAASFVLPAGWRLAHVEGDLALVDPGVTPGEVTEAHIVVASRALDERSAGRSAATQLAADLPDLVEDLAGQGVAVSAARPTPVARTFGAHPGAELTLQGRASGGDAVTVWIGRVRVEARDATALAVVLRGREDSYVAPARELLGSVAFAAPEAASTGAATDLAGLEFGHATFGSGSSLTTVYTFGPRGVVTRRTMFSSEFGGTDSEVSGSYTLDGQRVRIRVDGEAVEATLVREGRQVTGLRIGGAVYSRT